MKKDWLSAKQALSKYNISSQKNKCAIECPTVEDILIPSLQRHLKLHLMSLKMCHASFRLIMPHDILKKYLRNPFKPSLAKKSELKCTETISESITLGIHLIFWPWWVIILVYLLCPDFPSIQVIKPHYLGAFLLSQLM